MLCLTSGYRKLELLEALKIYGVDRKQIYVVHRPDIPDDIQKKWPKTTLMPIIQDTITKKSIDCVITFDKHGVSGHPNHISIREAAADLKNISKSRLTPYQGLRVETANKKLNFGTLNVAPISYLACISMFNYNLNTS